MDASPPGPGKPRPIAASLAAFFFLLSAYYIVRPVRDAMGIEAGVANLQWLFSATFVAMLLAAPVFAWATGRFPRRRLVPGMMFFFALNLVVFIALFASGAVPRWVAGGFFVWVSVFNLFSVSVFWSYMADLHDTAQAKRRFGLISAGGSAGAIVGPLATSLAATQLGTTGLLSASAALLVLAGCVLQRIQRGRGARARGSPSRGEKGPAPEARALSRGAFEGFRLMAASPMLRALCAYTLLYTALSTFLYFEQARIVQAAIDGVQHRTQFFARMDLATNVLTLVLQVFGTRVFLTRFGLRAALVAVPVLTLAGFVLLVFVPALVVIAPFQVLRRAGDFALGRPARETLFTLTNPEARYKAKNLIDTVVYRAGDAGSSWLASLSAAAGAANLAAPLLALLWIGSAVMVTKRTERLTRGNDPARPGFEEMT